MIGASFFPTIWPLTPVPDTELLNPLEFCDRNIFCSDEASLGRFLSSFMMGAGHWKDLILVRSLGLLAISPQSQGKGEGLGNELITDHAYVMKLPWLLLFNCYVVSDSL